MKIEAVSSCADTKGASFSENHWTHQHFFPSLVSWVSFVVHITGQLGCQTSACDFMFYHGSSSLLEAFSASCPCVCVWFSERKYYSRCAIGETIFFCVTFQTSCRTLLPSSSSPLLAPAWQRSREVVTALSPTLHPSSLCHPACLLLPTPCPSLHPSSPLAL